MKLYFLLIISIFSLNICNSLADGIWAHGYNSNGAYGNGKTTSSLVPIYTNSGLDWINISATGYHSLALKSDRTMWSWGENNYGQLGDGTNTLKRIPVEIIPNTKWLKISAGTRHSAAIKSDGTLWTWDDNVNGQLGDGTNTNKNFPVKIGNDNDWKDVSAGLRFTIALKTNGTIWGWGNNTYYELGNNTNISVNTPIQIGTDNNWAKITAGMVQTIALKTDGTMWGWGNSYYGQLSGGYMLDYLVPTQIDNATDWVDVSNVQMTTIALKSNGTLWSWGWNAYGQVGDGTYQHRYSPNQIGTDNDWIAIYTGAFNSAARKRDGSAWIWGVNAYADIGDGTLITRTVPTKPVFTGYCTAIQCGRIFTLELKANPLAINVGNKEVCPNSTSPELGSFTDDGLGNLIVNTATGGSKQYIYEWYPSTGLLNPESSNPIDPTYQSIKNYSLRVTDIITGETAAKNFIIRDRAPISIYLPLIISTQLGNSVNLGTNLSVSNATVPLSYYWTNKAGWSSTESNPSVTPLQSGINTYYLTVTDGNGCISSEKRIRVFAFSPKEGIIADNGLYENLDGVLMLTYPNPTIDLLNVFIDFGMKSDVTFSIVDISGRELMSKYYPNIESLEDNINVSSYNPGTYILIANSSTGKYVRKFIKK